MNASVHIAVQGCCHGELDAIYSTIGFIQSEKHVPIELLLVCGDFECIRDYVDLACVAVPPRYRKLTGFEDYVSGKKSAPVLTIFVGGNHEASNVLQELYYGGWVAPNIYFLGFGGVVTYKGIRIGGLSGIYNERHYRSGHFETVPFTEESMRSVYHVRELEVYRMAHLSVTQSASPRKLDIFLSHDWPSNVWNYGDCRVLLRKKKHLADDMKSNRLGSPPLEALLKELQPSYWFAAHLHVKFSALIPHYPNIARCSSDSLGASINCAYTKFLALDKVLPGRDFLQVLAIPAPADSHSPSLQYDPEWLAIVQKTHSLLSTSKGRVSVPVTLRAPRIEEIEDISKKLCDLSQNNNLDIPVISNMDIGSWGTGNVQTDRLLDILNLNHIWTRPHVPIHPVSSNVAANLKVENEQKGTVTFPSAEHVPAPDISILFSAELLQRKYDLNSQQSTIGVAVCEEETA